MVVKKLLLGFGAMAVAGFFAATAQAAGALPQQTCAAILQTAYAPKMARFVSCDSKQVSPERVKVIIHLKGGILGTNYTLKGYIDVSENGWVQTRWKEWDSVLTPVETSFKIETEKERWDF